MGCTQGHTAGYSVVSLGCDHSSKTEGKCFFTRTQGHPRKPHSVGRECVSLAVSDVYPAGRQRDQALRQVQGLWKSCIKKKKKVILFNLAFSEIIGSKILFSRSSSPGQCSALCSGNADRCEPESSRAGSDETRQHRCLNRHLRASPVPSSGHPADGRGKEEAGGASAEAKGGLSSFAFNFSVLFDHLTVGVNTLVRREGGKERGKRNRGREAMTHFQPP